MIIWIILLAIIAVVVYTFLAMMAYKIFVLNDMFTGTNEYVNGSPGKLAVFFAAIFPISVVIIIPLRMFFMWLYSIVEKMIPGE